MQKKTELVIPPDRVRVAAVLAKYPVHRLSRQRATTIEVREMGDDGEWTVRWRVSHNSDFGQPGPLAYKLDTLIINRKLDEVGRPVPRVIRLGGLKEIARELGLSTHDTRIIKDALYQNAFAGITAKIKYKGCDGSERRIEIGGTRYTVVMTGETLPDGREADAVYLLPNDFYRMILDTAQTRPLDYGYLRELSPASQRLYELLSFPMFGTIKHGGRARMRYSDFCTYAPQVRYGTLGEVRRQMERLHAPHRKAGYITSVEYQATTDRDGRPDWTMIYTPGPKAKAEYRAFTGKGGSAAPQAELSLTEAAEVEIKPEPELTGWEHELIARGVSPSQATELAREFPEDRIKAQIERVDWLREKRPKQIKDVGAYLTKAIREDYAAPAGFESAAQRAEKEAIERAQQEQVRQERARRQEIQDREAEIQEQVAAYWAGLSPDEQRQLEADALEWADPEARASCETGPTRWRATARRKLREAYIRHKLGEPVPD